MKIQLLYQKVYFKSNEWKELVSFISSLFVDSNIFLLSKNHVITFLKKIKSNFLGECLIIEIPVSLFESSNFYELLQKIESRYSSKLFLIGYLFSNHFISKSQLINYLLYMSFRKKNKLNVFGIHSFFLYETLKLFKLQELGLSLRLFFFRSSRLSTYYTYYY